LVYKGVPAVDIFVIKAPGLAEELSYLTNTNVNEFVESECEELVSFYESGLGH
jgi:hypothetical protein